MDSIIPATNTLIGIATLITLIGYIIHSKRKETRLKKERDPGYDGCLEKLDVTRMRKKYAYIMADELSLSDALEFLPKWTLISSNYCIPKEIFSSEEINILNGLTQNRFGNDETFSLNEAEIFYFFNRLNSLFQEQHKLPKKTFIDVSKTTNKSSE